MIGTLALALRPPPSALIAAEEALSMCTPTGVGALDTPAQMKTYVKSEVFPDNLIGLTGTPDQVAAAAKAYKFYYKKSGEGADYMIDHLSIMYLMDPNGNLARPLTHGMTPDEIATQIRDAMRCGPSVAA